MTSRAAAPLASSGLTLTGAALAGWALACVVLVGCGDDTSGAGGAGGAGASSTDASGTSTATGGDTTATGDTSASAGGGGGGTDLESYTVTWGPLEIPAGADHTQCVTKRLGNPGELQVGSIRNVLAGVSHHLIVYKVADTEEQLEPYDCDPFQDTLDPSKGMPLMITQKAEETLVLPEGVAFTLEPDQMLRLEMHYVNPGVEPETMEATSTMIAIAPGTFEHEAGFLFAGSVDVDVPAMSQATLGPVHIDMPEELEGKNFFAFTGHVHRHGTDVTVGMTDGDDVIPVYDVEGFEWSEPPTQYHDPEVVLGAGEGFDITCEWNNTSMDDAGFGEQASDEMCFFWAYYYPSIGSKVCAHTDQGGGIDLCCPGSSLCDQIF